MLTDTRNPNLVPALILLGSMVVPVAFVTFIAGQRVRYSVRASTVGIVALVSGVAAGAGFAVLETMGYALVVLVRSGGNITALDDVLLLRGALHTTWGSANATWVYVVLGAISLGVVLTATVVLHRRPPIRSQTNRQPIADPA